MKGESRCAQRRRGELSIAASQELAVSVLGRLAVDADRLGRFLLSTGLDPTGIRAAAASSDFPVAVLDYVAGDEALLLEIAGELGCPPEHIMAARRSLSPEADGDA